MLRVMCHVEKLCSGLMIMKLKFSPGEINYISKIDLTHALSLSETGFYELLKQADRCEPSADCNSDYIEKGECPCC